MRYRLCSHLATLALIPVLIAAAPAKPIVRGALIGMWFGVGEPNDPTEFYIDFYHADGTFNSEFRKCFMGQLVFRQTTSGTWRIDGDQLMMVSSISDGVPIHFEHNYDIESLAPTEFRARYHDPDYLFVEKRVTKFEFPACDAAV